MSATSFTDWQVSCDAEGCSASVWGSELDTRDISAAEVRKILRGRGWRVNVRSVSTRLDEYGPRERKDYCPQHVPVSV